MTDERRPDDFPIAWFNPDFVSEINYYHPETGELIDELIERAQEETTAARAAREAHPERVEAFIEDRRSAIRSDLEEAGGTLWHLVLADTKDWSAAELSDAGVAPSEQAAARFYDGFMHGTPGLDFSGTGAGLVERLHILLPDLSLEAAGGTDREVMGTRALAAGDVEEGHFLSGYLARAEFEERAARAPGSLGHAWIELMEETGGDVAAASLKHPRVIAEAFKRYVGDIFERGAFAGISSPRGDDEALKRVVATLRDADGLPRDVRVELAAATGALSGGRSDPVKLFSTFVRAGEALRPLGQDPLAQQAPEDSVAFAAGYATGQTMARMAALDREITLRSEGFQLH